jgi:hypothetical protein
MKNIKEQFEEINLHGYKIHIYENKVKIYKRDNAIENYDFKPICDRLVEYLMDEAFIPRKNFRIEMVTINPQIPPPEPDASSDASPQTS